MSGFFEFSRHRKSEFNCPAHGQASCYCASRNSTLSFPLRDRKGLTIARDESGCSPVIGINLNSSPSAISWFVVSIIIYAVNLMFFAGSLSHIGKEILKRLKPSIAYFNATASVIAKRRIRLIEAPIFHRLPSFIFWRFACIMSSVKAIAFHVFGRLFALQASTRLAMFTAKAAKSLNAFCSAITNTQNISVTVFVFAQKSNDCKPVKFLSNAVSIFRHSIEYKTNRLWSSNVNKLQFNLGLLTSRLQSLVFTIFKLLKEIYHVS